MAAIIVHNKNSALLHAVFMTFCSAGFLWLFLSDKLKKNFLRNVVLWGVVLLIAGDALWLSRHYIKTMPLSFIEENDVVKSLKKNMGYQKVALVTQQVFYNAWLTYLFPYHNIRTINVTQIPRMPQDYKKFLEAVGGNPVRFWQLGAVGYVLAPAQIVEQIKNKPALKDAFDVTYSYNVFPDEHGGMRVVSGTPGEPGQHAVLRFGRESPRYALVAGWMKTSDKESLENLGADRFPLFCKLMVAPESADGLPKSTGEGIVGNISVLEYRSGRVKLRVLTDRPAMLRASEKFDPNWKALIDGKPAPVRRVDYIFQGVFIEPGAHEVVLSYAQRAWPVWIQVAGILIYLCAAIVASFRWT